MDYECYLYNKNSGKLEKFIVKDVKSNTEITSKLQQQIIKQYSIASIKSIERKETKCQGCIDDKCDQKSHMTCPSGCLHDIMLCDMCS